MNKASHIFLGKLLCERLKDNVRHFFETGSFLRSVPTPRNSDSAPENDAGRGTFLRPIRFWKATSYSLTRETSSPPRTRHLKIRILQRKIQEAWPANPRSLSLYCQGNGV